MRWGEWEPQVWQAALAAGSDWDTGSARAPHTANTYTCADCHSSVSCIHHYQEFWGLRERPDKTAFRMLLWQPVVSGHVCPLLS